MKKTILGLWLLACLSLNALAENIYPISREMGSGTRSAFVDIFEIYKSVNNKKIDAIAQKIEITNSTGIMLTDVANSKNSIGYISLGALNNSIKPISINGVIPSVENITNKSYTIFRNFNVVTKLSNPLIEDFLAYTVSLEAKPIIQKAGYISVSKGNFKSKNPRGKLIIAGSSSVTPLMEKLKESYVKINPNADIEISQSDSTIGVNSVIEGIADIGMVSREVKESELKKGVKPQVLAIDGLAIIVNHQNPITNLTKEQVRKIFLGEITTWEQIQ